MELLIISDTHLTEQFDEKKYIFLKKRITQADKVIINGDFWDGYLTSFDTFVSSEWKQLFPLLKKKETVYLFGNHDKAQYADNRLSLFSTIQDYEFVYKWNGKKIIIRHGNKQVKFIDEIIPLRWVDKILTIAVDLKLIKKVTDKLKLDYAGSQKLQTVYSPRHDDRIYIYGHTHYARDDQKNGFINAGCILNGHASYVIITPKQIKLMEEEY